MNKRLPIFRTVLLVFLLGLQTPQFAQDTSKSPTKSGQERLRAAIGLVRTINTAEYKERYAYGSFASWPTLLAQQQEYLNEWLSHFYSRDDANVHFGSTAEILPGWNLRLVLQPDGLGYILLLEDAKDKNGYAALSDERGVIRLCKPLQ
jgi:hypothetical protein